MQMWRQTWRGFINDVAPRLCVVCGQPDDRSWCFSCLADVRASPLPARRFIRGVSVTAAFSFDEPIRRVIHAAKYQGNRRLLADFAALVAERLAPVFPSGEAVLVPVPLSRKRERARGFNQARELASAVAGATGRPVAEALARQGGVRPQVGRSRQERISSSGGFVVCASVPEQVVVIDDVVTTGATAAEAATVLQQGGAARIEVVAGALTPPHRHGQ